jgi:molybdopterin-guanine dinucleotide biosynthesis protein A
VDTDLAAADAPQVAAAIVAGGRARRFGGVVKPLLVVEGRRIIDRQLDVLLALFERVVIVANDATPFAGLGLPVIPDRAGPGRGPLAGIDAALAWLPPEADSVVCVAGDMPFLVPAILRALRDAPPAAAVVPRPAGKVEPLCARYHRALAPVIAAALSAGELAVHALLARPGVAFLDDGALRPLDPTLRSFANVNSPADLVDATNP